jgi:hypothetical protein
MQRKLVFIMLTAMLTLGLMGGVAAEENAWMDMPNCDMCKNLTANPEMLQHITWSHYDVKGGIMSVCTVEDAYAAAYGEASMAMGATAAKMMAGEAVNLCNMCTDYSGMMAEGAAMELVNTDFGNIRLTTSEDEVMVTRLHAWAETTRSEMAKMEAPKQAE